MAKVSFKSLPEKFIKVSSKTDYLAGRAITYGKILNSSIVVNSGMASSMVKVFYTISRVSTKETLRKV